MNTGLLIEDLIQDEGLRLKPYRCPAGFLSIGIGRNLDAKGITTGEAHLLCRNDIAEVVDEFDRQIPWWRELSEPRQRALVNMGFNLGVDGLLPGGRDPGFPKTIGLLKSGQYLEAAQQALKSKWAKQVGPRALRIAAIIRDGQ